MTMAVSVKLGKRKIHSSRKATFFLQFSANLPSAVNSFKCPLVENNIIYLLANYILLFTPTLQKNRTCEISVNFST